jgi:hypothetical protein
MVAPPADDCSAGVIAVSFQEQMQRHASGIVEEMADRAEVRNVQSF